MGVGLFTQVVSNIPLQSRLSTWYTMTHGVFIFPSARERPNQLMRQDGMQVELAPLAPGHIIPHLTL